MLNNFPEVTQPESVVLELKLISADPKAHMLTSMSIRESKRVKPAWGINCQKPSGLKHSLKVPGLHTGFLTLYTIAFSSSPLLTSHLTLPLSSSLFSSSSLSKSPLQVSRNLRQERATNNCPVSHLRHPDNKCPGHFLQAVVHLCTIPLWTHSRGQDKGASWLFLLQLDSSLLRREMGRYYHSEQNVRMYRVHFTERCF